MQWQNYTSGNISVKPTQIVLLLAYAHQKQVSQFYHNQMKMTKKLSVLITIDIKS